ncbi:hypothetical protein QBC34DRAFT_11062 [Podospora aff. communis PSN243]|uniref:Uncharacterized protein n=1 Tax=Podospora aff. communis PSN243 TaxID=3040156 RepID=A0AAV9H667_9PEZI|nr:hypothetical protein QBC34DRAFT_11062 [Podospora aff. communis PSN243]
MNADPSIFPPYKLAAQTDSARGSHWSFLACQRLLLLAAGKLLLASHPVIMTKAITATNRRIISCQRRSWRNGEGRTASHACLAIGRTCLDPLRLADTLSSTGRGVPALNVPGNSLWRGQCDSTRQTNVRHEMTGRTAVPNEMLCRGLVPPAFVGLQCQTVLHRQHGHWRATLRRHQEICQTESLIGKTRANLPSGPANGELQACCSAVHVPCIGHFWAVESRPSCQQPIEISRLGKRQSTRTRMSLCVALATRGTCGELSEHGN